MTHITHVLKRYLPSKIATELDEIFNKQEVEITYLTSEISHLRSEVKELGEQIHEEQGSPRTYGDAEESVEGKITDIHSISMRKPRGNKVMRKDPDEEERKFVRMINQDHSEEKRKVIRILYDWRKGWWGSLNYGQYRFTKPEELSPQLLNTFWKDLRECELLIISDGHGIPKEIAEFRSLKELELRNMHDIQHDFQNTFPLRSHMKYLTLHHCRLTELPDIRKFERLKSLTLIFNLIESLPKWIGDMEHLEGVTMCEENMYEFPSVLAECPIRELQLDGPCVSKFWAEISKFKKLTHLGIGGMRPHVGYDIPDKIPDVTCLEVFEVYGTSFINYKALSKFPNLKTLRIKDSALTWKQFADIDLDKFKKLENVKFHRDDRDMVEGSPEVVKMDIRSKLNK